MKRLYPLAFSSALCLSFSGLAQTIENIKAAPQANGKVIITFDIMNAKAGQDFNIQVFSSHNGFASPLTYLSGDVGNGIKPGSGKKAEWDAQGELRNYIGDLTFEVRGEIVLGWRVKTPSSASGVRRGKTSLVTWQGGSSSDNVRIELVNGGKTTTLAETKNTGSFSWSAPADLKTGGDYQLRLVSGGQITTSENFVVKSKIPLLLKLSPILLVGGAVAALGGGGGDKGGGGAPEADDLPKPPDPN